MSTCTTVPGSTLPTVQLALYIRVPVEPTRGADTDRDVVRSQDYIEKH
jgi:hypothetical protein